MGEGITVGRKGKPKVELTDETIRKLPAAAVIEKHRSLRVLLKKGLNEGKIQIGRASCRERV